MTSYSNCLLDEFVLNTFLTLQSDGWKVALDFDVCRSLEEIIIFADAESLAVLLKTFSKNWGGIIKSRFSYHILHKALVKCQKENYSDSLLCDFIFSFCVHMKERLTSYITCSHATHTCRLYLQVLSGIILEKDFLTST